MPKCMLLWHDCCLSAQLPWLTGFPKLRNVPELLLTDAHVLVEYVSKYSD